MNETGNFEVQPEYKPLDFGEVLKRAFDFYKLNLGFLILVHLVAGLLAFVTAFILAGPLYAGVCIVLLALHDNRDPKPVVGDIFKGFDYFLPAFLLFIVIAAATMLASKVMAPLFLVASMAIGTITMFSYFLIVERKMDFWPAIIESYNMVKGNFWIYLALYAIGSVVAGLGLIVFIIGVVVTAPYLSCVLVIAYRGTKPSVKDPAMASSMAPSTGVA